jgi:hypothetical protein
VFIGKIENLLRGSPQDPLCRPDDQQNGQKDEE